MKKGFTLIELIGVIVLLGILALLVTPTINKVIKNSKEKAYHQQLTSIVNSARKWGVVNNNKLSETTPTFISIQDLFKEGYIEQETIVDPRDSSTMDGCIIVEYNNSENKYKYSYIDYSCGVVGDPSVLLPFKPEYSCFTFDEATETITNYDNSCSKDVIVPQKIMKNDMVYDVKYIGAGSFKGKQITSVVLPIGLIEIRDGLDNGAFSGNKITSLVIPSTMTKIGREAFRDNNITSLDLSSSISLTNIAERAFINNKIISLDLTGASNLISIGGYSFWGNYISSLNLTGLSKLTDIYDAAFYANNLTSLDLSNLSSLKSIGGWAFFSNKISNLNFTGLPNLKLIDHEAFTGNKLTSLDLTILTNLTTVGDYAFAHNLITNVQMGRNITYVGKGSFYDNEMLVTININTNNPSYKSVNNGIYTKDGTKLIVGTKVMSNNIEPTTTSINDLAFLEMGVTSVTIPNSVTTIGENAFGANSISSLNLSSNTNLISIGNRAFTSNNLTSVQLSNSVNNIGQAPFSFNSNLVTITINASNPNYKSINNAIYTKDGKTLIQGTKVMSNNIESTTTLINNSAFESMGVTSVTIPNNVINIGTNAFNYNDISTLNLSGLTNLITIGQRAFASNHLTSITIPASVTTIGNGAFSPSLSYPWSSVTIQYNETNIKTRFNSNWTSIGWPSNLMP
ncbi:MAG: leucine-rich repeat protein [Bacilli bacterium]|nr:leucine-rich repeat protein [Bacilli bacterium]MDD4809150.1 leucine-rich repeat protein [Bacilli bacterium]